MDESLLALIPGVVQRHGISCVDLTGGAPELHSGFRDLVRALRRLDVEVIDRCNLTILLEPGFEDMANFLAENRVQITASLPCYLEDNVDKMRGNGVYQKSIRALQWLNRLGYGQNQSMILDLVYNPPVPNSYKFALPANQKNLEQDYKSYLKEHFNVKFNQLFTITNLPIGRTRLFLENLKIHQPYLDFLEANFNGETIENLMCRNELSIDYLGNVYDCDFNQMENIPAKTSKGETITVAKLLEGNSLDIIEQVQTANYCYGCTAGCGSSCGGALV